MNHSIKISVVIPTYHRNDFLKSCLQCLSAKAQTYPSELYEVIVTDDGTSILAREMIQEEFPGVKWIEGPRRGAAANRNNGARAASNPWIAFVDSDCLPEPTWLEGFATTYSEGCKVYEGMTTCKAGISSPLEESPINLSGDCLWSCNFMIEKDFFLNLGGFDEDFILLHLEDTEFRERVYGKDEEILFVKEARVDHPPRKTPFGKKHALLQENQYLFYYKQGNLKPFYWIHLRRFIMNQIYFANQFPISGDSVRQWLYFLYELSIVAMNGHKWDLKYKDFYSYENNRTIYKDDIGERMFYRSRFTRKRIR